MWISRIVVWEYAPANEWVLSMSENDSKINGEFWKLYEKSSNLNYKSENESHPKYNDIDMRL